MAIVNITINGRQIQARAGQTVLEAAQAAGIDIPTLCHHPALSPYGACRICLVEIERQRTLQPACTFPVTEGMVVHTESDKVVGARKFVLEMLFSERIHYCMFCPMSGSEDTTDCELQKIAYRYGLTHWQYLPNYQKRWPVDASRKYFVMDHSRCILCRRCIRACEEIVANHTLGVRERGARTMVCADDDVPFGESSCVVCGTCLQVCPTGALMDRRSVYRGHETDVERTKTTCMACPVGCGIEAVTRDNFLLRVDGDWGAANGGLLCVAGRFEAVDSQTERLTAPLVRKNGQVVETSWDEALAVVAKRLRKAQAVAGLASPRTTNESLAAFSHFFREVLKSDEVALLYGEVPPLDLGTPATLEDVPEADCVVVVGGNPLEDQKVLGYLTKRAFDHEARLIVVNDSPTGLDSLAHLCLILDSLSQVEAEVERAERPVILYGAGLSEAVYTTLRALPGKARFLPLVKGTNAVGATRLGLNTHPVKADALYVLAGDDPLNGTALPGAEFTVVQAAYRSAWTEAADVIFPAQVWTEKDGHIVNVEGRELAVTPSIKAPENVRADWAAFEMLSQVMHDA
jgi:formate dehydrogenase major subunit